MHRNYYFEIQKFIFLNIFPAAFLLSIRSYHRNVKQIEYRDLESTLEKLKTQCPTLYIPPAGQSDNNIDENNLPDDIKPLNDTTSIMDISRLVTHLTRAVVTARERVGSLLQELHPLKEKMIMLNDDCDEKKKVFPERYILISFSFRFKFCLI